MRIECAAVLFDSDGVLVDSHAAGKQAWEQVGAEFGFEIDDEIFASLSGVRAEDSLARFVAPDRWSRAVARLEDLEVEAASASLPVAGALALVGTIPDDRWAIVTSASRRLGIARWRGAGIAIPPNIVTAEDVTNGKPNPEPYVRAATLLGVDIADCLVVEDAPSGGRAGRAAGAKVLAVGSLDWSFEPSSRVADLTAVDVAVSADGRLGVTIGGRCREQRRDPDAPIDDH